MGGIVAVPARPIGVFHPGACARAVSLVQVCFPSSKPYASSPDVEFGRDTVTPSHVSANDYYQHAYPYIYRDGKAVS